MEKLRLHCDVILPAEAARKAMELKARGDAAPTVENGKAVAEALRLVAQEWTNAGPIAREVYALQQLRNLVIAAAGRVALAEVKQLQVVAGDQVEAYGAVIAMHPAAVSRVLEETGRAIGIDVAALLAPTARAATVTDKGITS